MDLKQSPFSLYDFLGYFFPGATAIFGFAYCLKCLGVGDGIYNFSDLTKASDLLPFVLAAYVSGHFFSLLSSFSIERYFIWHFDYPSKSLLRYPSRNFFVAEFSLQNVIKLTVCMLLLPITLVTACVCFFSDGRPGLVSQLDPLLSKIIRRKVTGLIVDSAQMPNPNHYDGPQTSDFFRLVYHYTLEKAPAHYIKMQNYVALFGFNRAMSLIFVSLFWLSLTLTLAGASEHGAKLILICAALSNLFFFGFAKFYRRFSLESLMALTVCYQIPDQLQGLKLPKPKGGKKLTVGHELRKPSRFLTLVSDIRRRIRSKSRNASHS
jgi:hypothetical protein